MPYSKRPSYPNGMLDSSGNVRSRFESRPFARPNTPILPVTRRSRRSVAVSAQGQPWPPHEPATFPWVTSVSRALIGNLIPRGGRRGPGGGGFGGGGRLATHVGPPLRLFPPAVRRLWPISRSHPGTPGVRGPSTGNMGAVCPLIPAVARPKSACSARVHGSQGSSGWSSSSRRRCSRKSGSTSWVIPGSKAGLDRTGFQPLPVPWSG